MVQLSTHSSVLGAPSTHLKRLGSSSRTWRASPFHIWLRANSPLSRPSTANDSNALMCGTSSALRICSHLAKSAGLVVFQSMPSRQNTRPVTSPGASSSETLPETPLALAASKKPAQPVGVPLKIELSYTYPVEPQSLTTEYLLPG